MLALTADACWAASDFLTVVTGCAGTGKSFLVKYIVDALKAQGKQVAITATTGMASVQVQAIP